jgi:hypothetical protein
MKWQNNRQAFSMLTAIFVIVLMATVAMLVMNLSGKMVKGTTAQFQREQAVLLAKSYTEYAVMAVSANDRNTTGNCLTDIDGNNIIMSESNGGYQVRVRIAYIGHTSEVDSCAGTRTFSGDVKTPLSPLNIIVDAYVEYKDLDHHDPDNAPWITYHKRTLQKI